MLFNILYYDQTKETESAKSSIGLTIGPITITGAQVRTILHKNEVMRD